MPLLCTDRRLNGNCCSTIGRGRLADIRSGGVRVDGRTVSEGLLIFGTGKAIFQDHGFLS